MRLLLVEDDPALAEGIAEFLRGQGDEVEVEGDGMRADRLLQNNGYDFVLLDVGLPGLGGYELVRRIRKRGQRMPVIVITARDALDDRIYGLDLGADDYLIKPYDLAELSARVKAVVRRSQRVERDDDEGVAHGPLKLQPASNSVLWHGATVVLTAREYRVLDTLVRRRGSTVTRQQLEAAVYGWNESIGSNAIEVHIHSLRRKLSPELIVTLRGIGYQLGKL